MDACSTDRLAFFSKSRDVAPGKGVREHINHRPLYDGLVKIPHWRRFLSAQHEFPFQWNGSTWASVDQAFQQAYIGLADKDGSRLSKHMQVQWDLIKDDLYREIFREKFVQCKAAYYILCETRDAELWSLENKKPVRCWAIEHVRSELCTTKN